jgi:hypothetical protein
MKWLFLAFVVALPALCPAQDFNYLDNGNGTAKVTGYTGSNAVMTIPDYINGLKVTGIADYAFSTNLTITAANISTNITSIGSFAFSLCNNLKNIIIPDSATSLGTAVFRMDNDLTNAVIGNGLTAVTSASFAFCSLRSVSFGTNIQSIEVGAFGNCELPHVTIPDSVTAIGSFAFSNNGLTNIVVGKKVTSIGDYAFSGNGGLVSVYFKGNAPITSDNLFDYETFATIYYLPGTMGWGPTFCGLPTALWNLPDMDTPMPTLNIVPDGQYLGLYWPSWATNYTLVSSSDLLSTNWAPVTGGLILGGVDYSYWIVTNAPSGRFFRLRQN